MGLRPVDALGMIATRVDPSAWKAGGATLTGCEREASETTVLAVWDDPVRVEKELAAGALWCPSCGESLGPWGWARTRELRAQPSRRLRPRRARCRSCAATHVLVPTSSLLRRRDAIEVIGAALVAKQAGQGHRVIAAKLGAPVSTVRGWLRRFARRAEELRVLATVLAHRFDAMLGPIKPRGSPFADALEAIGIASAAITRMLGPARSSWHVVAALTGALMLSTQPLPAP